LRFSTYAGKFESATFINFRKRLMHDTSGSVFLIVDAHPVHRCKADHIGRAGIDHATVDFKSKAVAAMRRLQKLPYLIRGFFADPNLRYIAD
jgi:hypothetical protein